MTDQFFTSLSRSIEQEAFKRNYVLKYSFSAFDAPIQHLPPDHRQPRGRRGDPGTLRQTMLKMLKQYFNNVVYTGLNSLNARYDQIICDGHDAAKGSCRIPQIQLGHKNRLHRRDPVRKTDIWDIVTP